MNWTHALAICCLVTSPAGAAAELRPTPRQHLVRKPPRPITVDGRLDEWDMAQSPYVITTTGPPAINRVWTSPENPVRGDQDLSGRAALYWDEQYLYVAGRMTDDHLIGIKPSSAGNQGPAGWFVDSLMFAVASFRQPLKPNGPYHAYPFIALRYAPPGPGARGQLMKQTHWQELERCDDYWKLPPGSTLAVQETPPGYDVEAAIPWAALGFTARAGERLFLGFIAADVDPGEPLNQVGWGYADDPRDYAVFRLADSDEALGLLTTSADEVPTGQAWAVRAELDALAGPARLAAVAVVDEQGKTVIEKAVGLDVPAGQTAVALVEFDAQALRQTGDYRVELRGGSAGRPPRVVATAPVRLTGPQPEPPLVKNRPGEIQHMPPDRVALNADTEHREGLFRHNFVHGRDDYRRFIQDHAAPQVRWACDYMLKQKGRSGYAPAILCVPLYQLTADEQYVKWARDLVDYILDKPDAEHYYFQFQGLTLYRYLTWLKDPASPFAPKDAEKRYRAWLHRWAADPPALMLSESGTHNRIWLRYSLLEVSRRAAEEDGQPVSPKLRDYLKEHQDLAELGDSDDCSTGYHWVFFRFGNPIWFYDGNLEGMAHHKGWRRALERYREMVSPSGACPQFGSNNGWHEPGEAMWAFELMSRLTRDGRWRWTSHRIAEYFYNHVNCRTKQYHLYYDNAFQNFLLAWHFADDTVKPVPPRPGSRVTWRHPIRPTTLEERRRRPGLAGHWLDKTQWIPDKAVLAGRPDALAFWGLVDLLPNGGHADETPGNLVALMVNGAALLAGQGYMDLKPEYQNVLWVEDLDGVAADPRPLTTEVPIFVDDPAFTFLRVRTERYQHLPLVYTRDLFFYKEGFLVVKDRVRFDAMMKVRLGPCFQTRCLGPECGPNWMNTYYDQMYYSGLGLGTGVHAIRNPSWDLLVYFSPREGRRHTVLDRYVENPYRCSPVQVRQTWSGMTRPGQEVTFTTVLLPHAPTFRPGQRLTGSADGKEPPRLEIAVDRDDLTVVRCLAETDVRYKRRYEAWVMLNDTGQSATGGPLTSDGRVAVVGHRPDGSLDVRVVVGGAGLTYRGQDESAAARQLPAAPLAMPEDLRQ